MLKVFHVKIIQLDWVERRIFDAILSLPTLIFFCKWGHFFRLPLLLPVKNKELWKIVFFN